MSVTRPVGGETFRPVLRLATTGKKAKDARGMNGTDPRTIAELKPSEFNPREITASAMAGLKESVAEFGDISGIVYNRTLDCLVAGHQRVEALRAKFGSDLKIEETEDGNGRIETPAGSFVVRFVEWDRNRTEAAMVVANNPAIQGDWTDGALEMLGRIQQESPNIMGAMNLDGLLANLKNSLETCEPPADFKSVDESVKTDYECPKCKFRWSGKQS